MNEIQRTKDVLEGHPVSDWQGFLAGMLGRPLCLIWTQNRTSMLSFRQKSGQLHLRLHVMFRHFGAPAHFMAVAVYIQNPRDAHAGRVLDAFVAAYQGHYARPGSQHCNPKGSIHDLAAIFAELNQTYFHQGCTAKITWGPRRGQGARRRRSLQLGCYVVEDNLIRVHPCLDQSFVPRFVVAFVVFHEMLHEVLGVGQKAHRRSIHPPEFIALESTHPDYQRFQAWERQYLLRLLQWRP